MKSFKNALTIALSSLFLVACGNYEDFKEDPSGRFGNVSPIQGLTFSQVREQVLEARCTKCHSTYNEYNVVKADLEKIVASVRRRSMPKDGPMEEDKIGLLLSWAAAGAPLGSDVGPGDQPDPDLNILAPNYASINRNLLAKKCTICHNPQGEVPFIDFSSRVALWGNRDLPAWDTTLKLFDFEKPEASYILAIVRDEFEPMPPTDSGLDPVTDKEMEVLKEWIELGLP